MDKNCLIQRKVLRSAVTKTISELDNCIAANDFPAASLAFTKLEEKAKRLFENDELVITYLSSHPDPDTDLDTIVENELEQNETCRDNFISAKVRFQEFSKIYEQKTQQLDISPSMGRLSINLPKLELIDFDGNPKNWFSFWSMFQKIDEDPKIEDDGNFAYLMQTTKGKAFDFVQSYHVSIYKVDQLDTYLRCLENLGVTKEKYGMLLYPLVEASIPEQILIACERERNSISHNSTANTHDLDLLIQFLRSEVVSAERLRIAKAFCAGEKDKNKTNKEVICGTIPKISKSDAECFTKNGIYLSDCENNDSDISVLLGADYLGNILTGSISQQPNGLTAVQTYLGRVAMGKSLSFTTCSNHAMPVISLLNGSKICDLWSLDILGIRDPVENKTRKDIDDDTF
ncbi:integrase catalytic domain-containing protein [Trichonephila clavata]|uniref:Integrase catalytic domain-containing protein n=1 Tax=Trichonephila clavata TaxID=2740835 RepID=A0A8X6HEF1_TRICU|nr:integrase catalytic domain-containing protein [Trichonephila clavata]